LSPESHSCSARPAIRTFSIHYREKYGQPVGKIPLDCGRICPNRASGGCVFCLPASFTPSYLNPLDHIEQQLTKGKKQLLKTRFVKYLAYFQQESCTAIPLPEMVALLKRIFSDDDCLGVILSTRPDMIERSMLVKVAALVAAYGKECLIELGLQTRHDRSLRLLNRNHSVQDFIDSVRLIRTFPALQVGAHLIFGIPGESPADMAATVRFVGGLGVDAVKLHHLQVIRGTVLADWHAAGRVTVFSLAEYLELLLALLPYLPGHVTVHRLWATAHPDLLIAPKWHVLAADLSRLLQREMDATDLWQGKYCG